LRADRSRTAIDPVLPIAMYPDRAATTGRPAKFGMIRPRCTQANASPVTASTAADITGPAADITAATAADITAPTAATAADIAAPTAARVTAAPA
jgi:hypothetical protein